MQQWSVQKYNDTQYKIQYKYNTIPYNTIQCTAAPRQAIHIQVDKGDYCSLHTKIQAWYSATLDSTYLDISRYNITRNWTAQQFQAKTSDTIGTHERHPHLALTGELWVYFVSYLEKRDCKISGVRCFRYVYIWKHTYTYIQIHIYIHIYVIYVFSYIFLYIYFKDVRLHIHIQFKNVKTCIDMHKKSEGRIHKIEKLSHLCILHQKYSKSDTCI